MLNVSDDEIRPLTSFQNKQRLKKARIESNLTNRVGKGRSSAARNKSTMVNVTTVKIFVMQLCEANC